MIKQPHVPWGIEFFKRHRDDDADESVPGRAFLDEIPEKVAARLVAVLQAVAAAPPPSYSGGGYWEAMHDEMAGFYEVRVDGRPKRTHYRHFCLLEARRGDGGLRRAERLGDCGEEKPFRTLLSKAHYKDVLRLGDEFRLRKPRSVSR